MAYSANNLTLQHDGGAGFAKRWTYTTADSFATVAASGYFPAAATGSTSSANGGPLTIGDIIELRFVDAVAIASRTSASGSRLLQVATNDGTTVTTQMSGGTGVSGGAFVDTTATTLTLSPALHANKTLTVSSAAPIVVTLPAATATGNKYRLVIAVAATTTGHTVVRAGSDVMYGIAYFEDTVSTTGNTTSYKTSAGTTITLNGGTKGGVIGDIIELEDFATAKWVVRYTAAPVGTAATPFS